MNYKNVVQFNTPTGTNLITMTSLEIAKITGKRHNNVLRDIRVMYQELGVTIKTEQSNYLNKQGKLQPLYTLNKENSITLVSGYNVKMRAAIVRKFMEIESQQTKSPEELIRDSLLYLDNKINEQKATIALQQNLIVEATEEVLSITKESLGKSKVIGGQKDTIEGYTEMLTAKDGDLTIQEAGKVMGLGVNKFYKLLLAENFLMKDKGGYQPYQRHIDSGHFNLIVKTYTTSHDGEDHLSYRTYITSKGMDLVNKRLNLI